MKTIQSALFTIALVACGGDDPADPGEIATYVVTGTVVDFETGDPIAGSASVTTDGIDPPPTISVTGPEFTLQDVPPGSLFHILAGSPPGYRSTYGAPIEVVDADVDGVISEIVSEEYLAGLATAFGVEASAGTGVLLAQVVDDAGAPIAGIPAGAFDVGVDAVGPFFLDADRVADPGATETSASGYVVVFDVPPGLYAVSAVSGSGFTMVMPDSPAASTTATVARVVVNEGEAPELPTGVSFSADVAPIFENRNCVACHDGSGIGKDLGGLHLNGSPEKMHNELAEEISPKHGVPRVDLENPENSLMLTMPSREDPPDAHPNITFASSADPDYLIILGWITEGALNN